MYVVSLSLKDFRNYAELELQPAPDVTVLVGPNAAGKTNALEAVSIACTGSSFRRAAWPDLVRWGAPTTTVSVRAEGESSPVDSRLEVTAEGVRSWTVNGKPRRSAAALAGLVPVVSFTPEDLGFVKGAADARREAIDSFGGMLSAAYAKVAKEYSRVVRQRNALLREPDADAGELRAWEDRLVETGGRMTEYRTRLLSRLTPHLEAAHASVGGEDLTATYEDKAGLSASREAPATALEVSEAIRLAIGRRHAEERARGTSLVGPHRDDIVFRIGGHDARSLASQGQQRTAVLAWKLAQVSVIREITGRTPVVLLDDVMSELDEARRSALTALFEAGVQAMITTANPGYFSPELLASAKVVEVGRGA